MLRRTIGKPRPGGRSYNYGSRDREVVPTANHGAPHLNHVNPLITRITVQTSLPRRVVGGASCPDECAHPPSTHTHIVGGASCSADSLNEIPHRLFIPVIRDPLSD